MKWSYSLGGGDDEPIIKDEPVYDSAMIGNGQYVALSAANWTAGGGSGYGCVNAVTAQTASAQGINGVGVSLQNITTAGNGAFYSLNAPQSVATSLNVTTGAQVGLRSTKSFAYSKVIINPLAVYRTIVSQNTAGTSDVVSCVAAASSASIQFVVTGLSAGTPSYYAGQWCYFCGSAGPNYGSLRKIVSNASAATFVLDYACTNIITTADQVIIFSEMNQSPNCLSTYSINTATTFGLNGGLGTAVSSNAAAITGANASLANQCLPFRVVENYIEGGAYTGGITELRYNVQGQYTPAYNGTTPLVNKLSTVNFWQDLISLSHAFNTNSTAY